ncbi:phospholipase D-like protein [Aliiruegeria haliotis]|uniref:Phospholipase D-like protein n=1 Tax=Aliiruegeria haliotis TaxID=1280846 RepID=A0A2T0RV01_9RHOB|nr:PLDc N-terminal domain-containing protein [Aliiruegeria haliotis]PRY24968.1 phospholipase D-like protein [Aliiruegeria haliotis]
MFELSGFFGVLLLVLDIWAIISIVGSTASTGSKVLWVLLVVLLPLVGFLIWFVAGPRSANANV